MSSASARVARPFSVRCVETKRCSVAWRRSAQKGASVCSGARAPARLRAPALPQHWQLPLRRFGEVHPAKEFDAEERVIQPPDEAQPALAAIHAAGGDELVQAMLQAFSGFATAQMAWIERQSALREYGGVASAARALRMSAAQVGAVRVAQACNVVELAGEGEDAAGVAQALETLGDALATAHGWIDGASEAG